MPEAMASSTPYWMIGLSTSASISLGMTLVAGRKRVPRPAAGNTAFRTRSLIQSPCFRISVSAVLQFVTKNTCWMRWVRKCVDRETLAATGLESDPAKATLKMRRSSKA